MNFDRVAKLAKLAASDSGVLTALQNDPARIRKPLQLSEAQVRALLSASAFSTARPALTTSRPENPVADAAALQLGTLGTLLPPEGQGAFPGTGELPPPQAAPSVGHTPHGTPHGSIPRTPSTPQTPRHSPGTPGTPGAPRQGSGTPTGSSQGSGQGNGSSSSNQQTGQPTSPCGCCSCDVAFVAITAQVSTTAQTALTAITSIAGLD
jgi:hypothetical protein